MYVIKYNLIIYNKMSDFFKTPQPSPQPSPLRYDDGVNPL